MDIGALLKDIQDFRSQIDQWGVTAETLIAVAFLALVMFVFSLREVLTWFLRVNTLREEMRDLKNEISELKALISKEPITIEKEILVDEFSSDSDKKKGDGAFTKPFKLDH